MIALLYYHFETIEKPRRKRKYFSPTQYLTRAKWDNKLIYTLQISLCFLGAVCFSSCHSEMYSEEIDRYWRLRNMNDSCDTRIEELLYMNDDQIKTLYLKHRAKGSLK